MSPDHTTDPKLRTWVDVPQDSEFPIQNLPHGIFRRSGAQARVGVAIGDMVLDLAVLAEAGLLDGLGLPTGAFRADSLHPLLDAGRPAWRGLRARVSELLEISNPKLQTDMISCRKPYSRSPTSSCWHRAVPATTWTSTRHSTTPPTWDECFDRTAIPSCPPGAISRSAITAGRPPLSPAGRQSIARADN